VVAVTPATRVASASSEGGFFSNLAKKVGIGGASETTATASPAPTPKPKPVAAKPAAAHAIAAAPAQRPAETKQLVTAKPQLKPTLADQHVAAPAGNALAGAVAVVPANSFDARFSAVR